MRNCKREKLEKKGNVLHLSQVTFFPFSQRDEYRDSTVKESKLQKVGKDTLEKIYFMLRESQRETVFPNL